MHEQFSKVNFLNMQSKAYAKAQGVPATWSQEDQGYIAMQMVQLIQC